MAWTTLSADTEGSEWAVAYLEPLLVLIPCSRGLTQLFHDAVGRKFRDGGGHNIGRVIEVQLIASGPVEVGQSAEKMLGRTINTDTMKFLGKDDLLHKSNSTDLSTPYRPLYQHHHKRFQSLDPPCRNRLSS